MSVPQILRTQQKSSPVATLDLANALVNYRHRSDRMAQLIITYHLKAGVTHEEYQTWVRDTDYPAMRGLTRVAAYTNYKVSKRLMGEGPLPFSYMELFDVPDLDGFLANDMAGGVVQGVMGYFMTKVENPDFLIADAVV
jgi:REDY-like protein HapK